MNQFITNNLYENSYETKYKYIYLQISLQYKQFWIFRILMTVLFAETTLSLHDVIREYKNIT